MAIETIKQIPTSTVTGLDLSQEMLNYGDKKLKKLGLTDKINLVKGDSENLNFQNGEFDAVTVAFGVRNFENLEKGLSEMLRVTKKNGMVTILEFSKPTAPFFAGLYNFYFKYILPVIGKMTSKDPKAYKYLFESVNNFPSGKDFATILNRCGYENVSIKPLTLGVCTIYSGYKP